MREGEKEDGNSQQMNKRVVRKHTGKNLKKMVYEVVGEDKQHKYWKLWVLRWLLLAPSGFFFFFQPISAALQDWQVKI